MVQRQALKLEHAGETRIKRFDMQACRKVRITYGGQATFDDSTSDDLVEFIAKHRRIIYRMTIGCWNRSWKRYY